MDMKIPQYNINYIGFIKSQYSRAQYYIGLFNFFALAYLLYQQSNLLGNYILFLIFMGSIFLLVALLDYVFILPSEIAFGNEQAAKHPNPIFWEIKEIKKDIKSMMEKRANEK